MSDDYVEAVLAWSQQAKPQMAQRWLEQQGLTAVPIQAGLLLSGSADAFNRVFGCDVNRLPRPARLPVPAPLAPHVDFIEIPRPRRPMGAH